MVSTYLDPSSIPPLFSPPLSVPFHRFGVRRVQGEIRELTSSQNKSHFLGHAYFLQAEILIYRSKRKGRCAVGKAFVPGRLIGT